MSDLEVYDIARNILLLSGAETLREQQLLQLANEACAARDLAVAQYEELLHTRSATLHALMERATKAEKQRDALVEAGRDLLSIAFLDEVDLLDSSACEAMETALAGAKS